MKYTKTYYPDGASYTESVLDGTNLTFFINSYEDLWSLGQILENAEHRNYPLTVTIPNLIDAQADRRFSIEQPHSLKLVLSFLSQFENVSYNIFHPHNQEVVEAMLDKVIIIDNTEFIKRVLQDTGYIHTLMSSDAGGFKPLMKLCDKIDWQRDTFSASKSRKYVDGKTKLVQQIDRADFKGENVLIVDDICVKGGTFVGLAKMLRERNVGKLFLAVSHLTLETVSQELIDSFDTIYTTNSKGFKEYKVLNSDTSGHDRVYDVVAENVKVIKVFN